MSSLKKSCKEDVKIMNSKINSKFDVEHVCIFKNVSLKKRTSIQSYFQSYLMNAELCMRVDLDL